MCAAAYSFSVFYIFSCFKNTFDYFRQIYIIIVILINKKQWEEALVCLWLEAEARSLQKAAVYLYCWAPPDFQKSDTGSLWWNKPDVDLRIATKTQLASTSQSFCLTCLSIETIGPCLASYSLIIIYKYTEFEHHIFIVPDFLPNSYLVSLKHLQVWEIIFWTFICWSLNLVSQPEVEIFWGSKIFLLLTSEFCMSEVKMG